MRITIISIHAPTRGATIAVLYNSRSSVLFQSTLLQEERQIFFLFLLFVFYISIHAPTRGATKHYECDDRGNLISIHAPTRGATRYAAANYQFHCISIHAPTRGATWQIPQRYTNRSNFNPRSYKRSDDEICVVKEENSQISIHAPTRGATLIV